MRLVHRKYLDGRALQIVFLQQHRLQCICNCGSVCEKVVVVVVVVSAGNRVGFYLVRCSASCSPDLSFLCCGVFGCSCRLQQLGTCSSSGRTAPRDPLLFPCRPPRSLQRKIPHRKKKRTQSGCGKRRVPKSARL